MPHFVWRPCTINDAWWTANCGDGTPSNFYPSAWFLAATMCQRLSRRVRSKNSTDNWKLFVSTDKNSLHQNRRASSDTVLWREGSFHSDQAAVVTPSTEEQKRLKWEYTPASRQVCPRPVYFTGSHVPLSQTTRRYTQTAGTNRHWNYYGQEGCVSPTKPESSVLILVTYNGWTK